MDIRPGQVPLMPTLAPPLGLGLGPGHLGLPQQHAFGHPFQQPGDKLWFSVTISAKQASYSIQGNLLNINAKFGINADIGDWLVHSQ